MKSIIISLSICCAFMLQQKLFAQQWFFKHWDTEVAPVPPPDYEPGGSFMVDSEDEVLLYGTIGFSRGTFTSGFGNSDVLINKNDLSGSPIWTLVIGTSENEYVSRVIEDRYGNLVVLLHRITEGMTVAHILKIQVTETGGQYTFTKTAEITRNRCNLYDIIEVFSVNGAWSRGYAILGYDNEQKKSFILKADHQLQFSGSGYWNKYIVDTELANDVKLYSLIQQKSSIEGRVFTNVLAACGRLKMGDRFGGYVVRINHTNASLVNDFFVEDYEDDPVCDYHDSWLIHRSRVFTEIISTRDGNLLCLGKQSLDYYSTQEVEMSLVQLTANLNQVNWFSRVSWHQGSIGVNLALDLHETDLTYCATICNPDNSSPIEYTFAHFLKDGSFYEAYTSEPQNEFGVLSYTSYGGPILDNRQRHWKDYALSCDNVLHFPGTLAHSGQSPNGWSVGGNHHVIHGATNLFNYEDDCISTKMGAPTRTGYCNTIKQILNVNGYSQASTNIQFSVDDLMELGTPDANFEEECASTCESSFCTENVVNIDVCANEIDESVELQLRQGLNQVSVLWSTGETGNSISVLPANVNGPIHVAITDASGCVIIYEYNIVIHPELILTETFTPISCHGETDGELCVSGSQTLGWVDITFNITGGAYGSTSHYVNGQSFCVSDILNGGNGLAAGTYTITATDLNGCEASIQVDVTEPTPLYIDSIGKSSATPNNCDGAMGILPAGGSPAYTVYIVNTSNGIGYTTIVPPGSVAWFYNLCPALYAVHVTDYNGCTATLDYYEGIDDGSGKWINTPREDGSNRSLDEQSGEVPTFSVFPNPVGSGGLLSVKSSGMQTLELSNAQGQQVMKLVIPSQGSHAIQLPELSSGVYTIRSQETGVASRIVVQ